VKSNNLLLFIFLFFLIAALNSCTLIEGVFKAGMGYGIMAILAILVIVVFVIVKLRGK
jgi:hypothetical protein